MAFKGLASHLARIRRLQGAHTERLITQALFAAGQKIQVEAQISITKGAVSGKNHIPSTAPEPPNQDTGVLSNNIETVLKESLLVEVSSNAPYAAAQEFGYDGNNLPERPYMRPARDKMLPDAKALVERAMNHAVRESRSSTRS